MSVVETPPSTLGEEAKEGRPDYWLEHTEGFQVFGPSGRIGFVELVVCPEEGADGLVIRTGLFRTWTVFVPSHEVGAVVPGTGRLELLIAPRAWGERISHFTRELGARDGLSNSASGEITRASATGSAVSPAEPNDRSSARFDRLGRATNRVGPSGDGDTRSRGMREGPETIKGTPPGRGRAQQAETMAKHHKIAEWHGKDLVDRDGEKIGKLEDVYVDAETDEPMFGTVKEGLIGRHLTFVPLGGITIGPDNLQVSVSRKQVKDAPNIDMHGPRGTSQASITTTSSTTPRPTRRAVVGLPAADLPPRARQPVRRSRTVPTVWSREGSRRG